MLWVIAALFVIVSSLLFRRALRTRRANAAKVIRQTTIISARNSLYERPQIQEAAAEARAAIPRLRELFSAQPLRASVLVRHQPPHGPSEVVWAGLVSINESTLTCHIQMSPSTFPERRSIQYSCALSALLDWSVTTAEREVRGGYTLKGMRQLARDLYGDEPAKAFDKEMRQYVDWKDIERF